jgi:hypothetical protein
MRRRTGRPGTGDDKRTRLYCKIYKTLHEKKEKENGSQGIQSPYIYNSFFLPRD